MSGQSGLDIRALVLHRPRPLDGPAPRGRADRREAPHRPQQGERTLLFFYFSGHAGRTALELGADPLGYEELRHLMTSSTADVKVAVVDACEAGGLTNVKGTRPVPLVDWEIPADDVEGVAFIASTARGELAQESAFLGGSFFSHHLEVALRGRGDADRDGRVTLGEAFRYAAAQTVSGTAATAAGPQHPTYEVKMSGRGEVILTELRRAQAHLVLPPAEGALYILRGPGGLYTSSCVPDDCVDCCQPYGGYGDAGWSACFTAVCPVGACFRGRCWLGPDGGTSWDGGFESDGGYDGGYGRDAG